MSDEHAKQAALESSFTMASVIHAIILQQYGEESYEWDPATISLELAQDFRIEVDTSLIDKWSALQIVMTSDAYFKRLDAFLSISNTLASGAPFFQFFDPATVEECAWSLTEASLNREFLPFSYSIKKYLRTVLAQDGYDDDNLPQVFQEVFDVRPSALDIRKSLGELSNTDKIEAYIEEEPRDLVYQFNKIPSLKTVDDMLLRRSLDEYIGDLIEGKDEVV